MKIFVFLLALFALSATTHGHGKTSHSDDPLAPWEEEDFNNRYMHEKGADCKIKVDFEGEPIEHDFCKNPPKGILAAKPVRGGDIGLKNNEMALTFDDGPTRGVTEQIRKTLLKYGISATFFPVGSRADSKRGRDILKKLSADGHIIANHTYTHETNFTNEEDMEEEFLKSHRVLASLEDFFDPKYLFFRPPGLVWNLWRFRAAKTSRLIRQYAGPIHADLGATATIAADWACWSRANPANPTVCANRYFNEIKNKRRRGNSPAQGGIVLFHDLNMKTAQLLKILLEKLDAEGGIKNKHCKEETGRALEDCLSNSPGKWSFLNLDSPKFQGNLNKLREPHLQVIQ